LDYWTLKKAVLWPSEISIIIHPAIQPKTSKDLAINVQEVTTLYVRNLSDKVCGNGNAERSDRGFTQPKIAMEKRRLLWKYFSVQCSQIFEKQLLYFDRIHPVLLWMTVNYKLPLDNIFYIYLIMCFAHILTIFKH
jgi:hypothetical protein